MKLATNNKCTGCMACIDSCVHNALKTSIDQNGFYCIDVDENLCVECGICSRVCPVINYQVFDADNIKLSKPYAAWCTNNELRQKSASGGAFAAIANAFINQGAVIYGASIDGFEVRHIRIDRKEDLPLILGSKYQHSRLDGVYLQVKNDLKSGKTVLFGGLSCQVAGLLNFIGDKLKTNLFVIDTICGGVSTMLPMLKMEYSNQYMGIHSFRNKDNGWRSKGFTYSLKMIKKDGGVQDLGHDNLMIKCFNNKETKRASCLDCHFNGFHRQSDATIGDFWGDTNFKEQHYAGLSIIVLHSERLIRYLENACLQLSSISWEEMLKCNPCYYWNHYPFIRHSLIRKIIFNKLRKGDEKRVILVMEKKTPIKYLEFFFYRKNERMRISYFKSTINKLVI